MSSASLRLLCAAAHLSLSLLAFTTYAAAAAFRVDKCEPALAEPGELLLITLEGEFPGGNLHVEFFPQRIQVLSATSVGANLLAVQVRVPHEAPAGLYNILVYNDRGEEGLGSELLEIRRRVRVPRVESSSPGEVDAGLTEVKLILNCDVLDPDALSHLRLEWVQAGQQLEAATSSFSRQGVNRIGVSVHGEFEAGETLGKLYFDDTPIFLIKLLRVSSDWALFGHRPSRVVADAPGCEISLLGRALTASALASARAALSGESTRNPIRVSVEWMDSSRARAAFSPMPEPGDYLLEVVHEGVVVYQGPFSVVAPRSFDQRERSHPDIAEAQRTALPAANRSRQEARGDPSRAGWEQALPAADLADEGLASASIGEEGSQAADELEGFEAGAEGEPSTATAPEQQSAESQDTARTPVVAEMDSLLDEGAEQERRETGVAAPRLQSAWISPGHGRLKLELTGDEIEALQVESLTARLQGPGAEVALSFMAATEHGLLLLFAAPAEGWLPGEVYALELSKSDDGAKLFSAELCVQDAAS